MNLRIITLIAAVAAFGVMAGPADAAKKDKRKASPAQKSTVFERASQGTKVEIKTSKTGRKITFMRVMTRVSCTDGGSFGTGEDLTATIAKDGTFTASGERITVTGKFLNPVKVKVTVTASVVGERQIQLPPGVTVTGDLSYNCSGGPATMTIKADKKTVKNKKAKAKSKKAKRKSARAGR